MQLSEKNRPAVRRCAIHRQAIAALALACLSLSALAVLPLLAAGLGKQIIQNMIINEVKGHLIGALAQQGCKGAKLISLYSEAERLNLLKSGRAGLTGGMMPPGGLPRGMVPPAGAMAPGMPGMQAMPGGPNMAELMARMQQQAGGGGPAMTPEQLQQASQLMGQMQDAMSHPLTRAETLDVFGQLRDMGMLPADMYAEARDCILLADESASQSIGASGALFKAVVLPQLVDLRAKLAALPPEQRAQLADQLSLALNEASAADRQAFREGLGRGLIPPDVIQNVGGQGGGGAVGGGGSAAGIAPGDAAKRPSTADLGPDLQGPYEVKQLETLGREKVWGRVCGLADDFEVAFDTPPANFRMHFKPDLIVARAPRSVPLHGTLAYQYSIPRAGETHDATGLYDLEEDRAAHRIHVAIDVDDHVRFKGFDGVPKTKYKFDLEPVPGASCP